MASSSFELISQKLVKPSSQTPSWLAHYKLSLLDQFYPTIYIPVAFFYPKRLHQITTSSRQTPYDILEESLSKTLSYYYPFAGRLADNNSVNCNDMGATFVEAQSRSPMSEVLASSGHATIFPCGLPWNVGHDDQPSLLVVQLTHFDCGGKVISVCLKHNICDAYTLYQFVNDWASIARQSIKNPSPQFIGASVLPPVDDPSFEAADFKLGKNNITRRYTFDSKILSQLKGKAITHELQNPTRVEVVSALLYKCAVSATSVCSVSFKPSVLIVPLNLRPLIGPPATPNYAGNMISTYAVLTRNEEEIDFSRLVTEMRRAKLQQTEKYKEMTTSALISDTLGQIEQMKTAQGMSDMDLYYSTSWCRFPGNNIDFGWGSPVRVSSGAGPIKNLFILTDIPNDNGTEATVTLEEQVMSVFESDPEILQLSYSSRS